MPTTSNFGWTTPADTDLVKDGALAIRTLGNGIDTSMAELKGGTTGQVLSKTSNTDMDFTWVTTDDANAIQNAIVDAKGDLIAATANDTPARLAVGNNGETLVANSSASVGLSWNPSVAAGAKNFVINGSMDFWQRGTTSFVGASPYYTADRWQAFKADNSSGFTFSQQTASLDGFTYSLRAQRNSGNTATASAYVCTSFESIDARRTQGQKLTLSFWAKAGANYSPTSSLLQAAIVSGTGTDGNLAAGFTSQATIGSSNVTLTTSWQKFTVTTTNIVASTVTQLGIFFKIDPTGTAGANDWVEITGVQLEIGSVATSFARAGGTLAGEFAAAMRYFQKYGGNGGDEQLAMAQCYSTTQVLIGVDFKVPMRISPSYEIGAGGAAGDFRVYSSGGSELTVTALTAGAIYSNSVRLLGTVASGLVAGNASALIAKNTNGRLFFSAEL